MRASSTWNLLPKSQDLILFGLLERELPSLWVGETWRNPPQTLPLEAFMAENH